MNVHKISLFRSQILALFAALFAIGSASATTIKMVSWAIDESYKKTDASPIKQYLINNGIDFGVFEFSKGASYFLTTSDFKKTDPAYVVETITYGKNDYRHIVYRSDRYTLVNDPSDSTYKSGDYIGAVFQDANGEQYALLSLRGTYEKSAGSAKTYIEGVAADAPSAKIFATSTARLASTYFSVLDTYLTETEGGPKMTCLGKGEVSGYYTYPATVPTAYSVADAVASGATYTGTVCTITVPTKYRVKFLDMDGETELQNTVVNEGESVTPPAPPVHQGYQFTGWDHEATTYANVQSNMDIAAQYEISGNYHEVTFQDYDGTELKTMSVEDGQDAVPPDDPSRGIAWEFTGWEPGYTKITEDRVCVAQYQKKSQVDIADADGLAEALAEEIPATTTLKFTSDIDCDGTWTTVDSFVGILDGNGHTITNLPNDAMLFTTLEGTVKNLTFANVGNGTSYGHADRAIVARQAKGAQVSNCTFNACVRNHRATNARGALIFVLTSTNSEGRITKIVDCTARNSRLYCPSGFSGFNQQFGGFVAIGNHLLIERGKWLMDDPEVIAIGDHTGLAGGFIGQAATSNTVIGCYNEGKIQLDHAYGNYGGAAGLIGGVSGKTFVYDCTNVAAMVGTHDSGAGGIVGAVCKTPVTVRRCVNRGTITSSGASSATNPIGRGAGGIMGGAWGNNSSIDIFDCANFGAVSTTTNATPAGGIIGTINYQADVITASNCYNYASVYSEDQAGGILGSNFPFGNTAGNDVRIYNSGNVGSVTSLAGTAGGVVGRLFIPQKGTTIVKGVLQAGAVSVGAGGKSGGVAGNVYEGTGYVKRQIVCESVLVLGSVSAGDGGQCAQIVGGSAVADESHAWTLSLDDNCRVLDSSLHLYYDYTNTAVDNAGAVETMTTAALKNGAAKRILNTYALANGHERWVQTKNYPELARFGKEVHGMLILFR